MIFFYTVNYFDKYSTYFSYPKSWVMWAIIDLHDYLMFFIINIFLVVLIFMIVILFVQQRFFSSIPFIYYYTKFNAKDYNDEPWLEFFWTILPALLLTVMSWPSFTLLYAMEQLIDPFHTVIIVGNQWYWSYQYSDFDAISDMIIQLDSYRGLRYFSKLVTENFLTLMNYDDMKYLVSMKKSHISPLKDLVEGVFFTFPNFFDQVDQHPYNVFVENLTATKFPKGSLIFSWQWQFITTYIFYGPTYDFILKSLKILSFEKCFYDNFVLDIEQLYSRPLFITYDIWEKSMIKLIYTKYFNNYSIIPSLIIDFNRSLRVSNQFNYFDLIQFVGKYARRYENNLLMYDAVLISDDNLPTGYPRLLCTDQVLILPANISMRLLITSNDVIHSWALPSHGIKMDAIPGRINQVPFLTPFWGTYRGQCSELCGINHGFMPIEVRVVCLEDYLTFLKLNISYKYDKFCPLLRNLILSYLKFLIEDIVKKEK